MGEDNGQILSMQAIEPRRNRILGLNLIILIPAMRPFGRTLVRIELRILPRPPHWSSPKKPRNQSRVPNQSENHFENRWRVDRPLTFSRELICVPFESEFGGKFLARFFRR